MNRKRQGSGILSLLLMIAMMAIGVAMLSYPTVANVWNGMHQTHMVHQYNQVISDMDNSEVYEMIDDARKYNLRLSKEQQIKYLSEEEYSEYEDKLDITGTGIMAYVDIPCIDCVYPVYHGTSKATLQIALGHVEWSSLPVGGESTHTVISGHCGLVSAELFTRLDEVMEGEIFQIHVGDETYNYTVDMIEVVEPEEMEDLIIVEGKDYCTLLTCTPYGINSHRLLVRGERTYEEPGQREGLHIGFNETVFIIALAIAATVAVFAVRERKK